MENQINDEIRRWKMVEEITMYNEFQEMKIKIKTLENIINKISAAVSVAAATD